MGLLDDAIREHLDLKRRRGADPTEVERLEREALGPVRRGAQTSEGEVLEQDVLDHQDGEPAIFDDQADGPYTEVMQPEAGPIDYVEEQDHELVEPLHDERAFSDETPSSDEPPHEPFLEDESEKGWTHEPAEEWEIEEPLAPEDPAAPAAGLLRPYPRRERRRRRLRRRPSQFTSRITPASRRSSTTSKPRRSRSPRATPRRKGKTSSRRRPSSSRTLQTTIVSGSNSARRRISTSTSSTHHAVQ